MPSRFTAGVTNAAPLQVQVTAGFGQTIKVVGFVAAGENDKGSAARPTLTRPASPGVGIGFSVPLNSSSAESRSDVVTSFVVAPSIPSVSLTATNLPMRVRWEGQPFVAYSQGAILLYGAASGGHLWTGSLVWEEV